MIFSQSLLIIFIKTVILLLDKCYNTKISHQRVTIIFKRQESTFKRAFNKNYELAYFNKNYKTITCTQES